MKTDRNSAQTTSVSVSLVVTVIASHSFGSCCGCDSFDGGGTTILVHGGALLHSGTGGRNSGNFCKLQGMVSTANCVIAPTASVVSAT
jgi:hypothetical protein